jgi:PAS domain S-box-containing protein
MQLSERLAWGLIDSVPDGLVAVEESGRIVLVNRQAEEMFGYDQGELLGQTIEVLLPAGSQVVHRSHRARYRSEPRVRAMGSGLQLQGRRRDGSLFPLEISLSPLASESSDTVTIAAVRDIADRVAAEALDREVRHGLDIVEDGVFMFDAETLKFRYVNQGAVNQVGYTRAELLEMTPVHLKPEFTEKSFRELLTPLLSNDVASVHFTTTHRDKDGHGFPVEIVLQSTWHGEPGSTQSCLAVVRDIRDRIEHERELASALQHASVLADRERMARDMHDTVIQELFATGMALQAAMSTVDDPATADRFVAVIDSIDNAIKQIRGTIFGLRDPDSWPDDIESRIVAVVESTGEALGFDPAVNIVGPVGDLPADVVDHLLPTVREALTNTARHAGASAVEVTIDATESNLTLRVLDDGVGISGVATRKAGGQGLRNMHDRAIALGGSCEIVAEDSGGTRVLWRVPR